MIDFIKKQLTPKPSYIFYTLAAFLLVNAFWLVAAHWIFVFRPYLNYDYALAFLLAPFSMVLTVIALVVVYGLEQFIIHSAVFHFSTLDFLKSSRFVTQLNIADFINWQNTLLFAGFLACAVGSAWFLKKRSNAFAVLVVLVLAFGADQLNGSSYLIRSDNQKIQGNIGGSSVLKLYVSIKEQEKHPVKAVALPPEDLPMPSAKILKWADEHKGKSILFVVVESLGQNTNKDIDAWLKNVLAQNGLDQDYIIESGSALYHGATTSAEMRHICGLKGNYTAQLNDDLTQNCIPKLLAAKGYHTVGAHGFSGNMFRRNEWWPQIGLQDMLFANEFKKESAPFCGSGLYGVCDDFIIKDLTKRMAKEPGFYYHLTLNTHLPIVSTKIPPALQTLCDQSDRTDEACVLDAKVGEYFAALSKSVAALDDKPLVFLVGDHAPPFGGKASRADFDHTHTPYFILTPR